MGFGNTKRDGSGNQWFNVADWGGRLIPGWVPTAHIKESSADNDYILSVGAAQRWNVHSVYADYTSTATVGNRQLALELLSGGDTYLHIIVNGFITASQNIKVTWGYGLFYAVVTGLAITIPTPKLFIPANGSLRVYDVAGVDAADTMDVYTVYSDYNEVP